MESVTVKINWMGCRPGPAERTNTKEIREGTTINLNHFREPKMTFVARRNLQDDAVLLLVETNGEGMKNIAGGVRLLTRASWHGHGACAARGPSIQCALRSGSRLATSQAKKLADQIAARGKRLKGIIIAQE